MLKQSTVSESAHFYSPVSATTRITLEGVLRKPVTAATAAPLRRIPPKRLSCKTCQGACCIGRCRF